VSSTPDVSDLRGIAIYSSFTFSFLSSSTNETMIKREADEVMCGDRRHICDLRSNNTGVCARTGGEILDPGSL
jgi:hypothetical protein